MRMLRILLPLVLVAGCPAKSGSDTTSGGSTGDVDDGSTGDVDDRSTGDVDDGPTDTGDGPTDTGDGPTDTVENPDDAGDASPPQDTGPDPELPPCEITLDYAQVEQWGCAMDTLCDTVTYQDDSQGGGGGTEEATIDLDAATCALEAFRDRTPGILKLKGDYGGGGGQFSDSHTIYIVDDTHGLSNWSETTDDFYETGRTHRQLLKPASFFDDCLSGDAAALQTCLWDWSAGCGDVAVGCPE